MAVGVFCVGRILGERFGQEQQVGRLCQCFANRHATTDMEQRFVRAIHAGSQTDGFCFWLFSHLPPPVTEMH
ncbi:hypothetical protein D9M70_568880 [compost metagenome]